MRHRGKVPDRGVAKVTPDQVSAFRLARHHLLAPAPLRDRLRVLHDIGGAQAQVLSSAELSLALRVRGLRRETFEQALWKDRSMVRAWCMRRTLHLLPSADLAVFVRGSAGRAEKEIRWALGKGVNRKALEGLLTATLDALEEPVTAPELVQRVARDLRLPQDTWTGGGWGNARKIPSVRLGRQLFPGGYLLHLVGARGVICHGPPRGTEATYVRGETWVPRWRDTTRERAEEELLRIYLGTYGPADPRDFVGWSRILHREAVSIFHRLEDELVPVESAGRKGWMVRRDLPALLDRDVPSPSARLLPNFDVFLLGHWGRDHLARSEHLPRVYRPQGWVAPTILENGRVAGVWSQTTRGRELRIRLEPFHRLSRSAEAALRADAAEVARFLGLERATLTGARSG
ncbi:MAG: AlkZ family DNA glycosylase [Euryarchaeota archaeon]|nr:AlkZ family DNA glycosylase [Euryarchaeota archaeon]